MAWGTTAIILTFRLHRVPPLGVVLQYARCAGVPMEMIVDDDLDLPEKLPAVRPGLTAKKSGTKVGNSIYGINRMRSRVAGL
jgi:hypothetical protein